MKESVMLVGCGLNDIHQLYGQHMHASSQLKPHFFYLILFITFLKLLGCNMD